MHTLDAFLLKIRSGCDIDSNGRSAGKGPLIQTNLSATLGVTQDQYLFQPKKKRDKKEVIVMATQQGGAEILINKCPTITAAAGMSGNNQPVACYNISPYESNAFKSKNPHSGIQKVDTTRTLDMNGGNPACNQGGLMVLAAIEGNGTRPSHSGLGISTEDKMYTLNSTEVHGVVVRKEK